MTTDTSELLKWYTTLLGKRIRHEDYDFLVSLSNELSDAVTEQYRFRADNRSFTFPRGDTPEAYIISHLGHLAANPSEPDRRSWLMDAFVYAKDNAPGNSDRSCPNFDEPSGLAFVENLIEAAHSEGNAYRARVRSGRDIFVLHGPRGVGKTIFINHLFTKFNDLLENEKIIWLRINLPEPFGGDRPKLVHWLLSKLAYVVLRYLYTRFDDIRKEFLALPDYFKAQNYTSEVVNRLLDNFDKVKRMYLSGEARQALEVDTFEERLVSRLSDQLVHAGYSFIFVLDGYDRVDPLPRVLERFDFIKDELNHLFKPDTRLGGCYLLVTRSETLRYLTPAQLYNTANVRNTHFRELHHTSFSAILDRRLGCLRRKLSEPERQKLWPGHDWAQELLDFKSFMTSAAEVDKFDNVIGELDRIYGSNNRAKVQAVQLCYQEYLKPQLRYRLIESMCRGGFEFPPRVYEYDRVGHTLVAIAHSKVFDNVFVPNVFRFPYSGKWPWNPVPKAGTYLLAGLRVLQLLQAKAKIDRVQTEEHKAYGIPIEALLSGLGTRFGYEAEVIFRILEEYAEYGLIMLESVGVFAPTTRTGYRVLGTPKMDFIYAPLRRVGAIYNVAYLNMCAMRTLVNAKALRDDVPFFRATTMEGDGASLADWIVCKLVNSLSLFRLLREAGDREEAQAPRSPGLPEVEASVIGTELKESILTAAELILAKGEEGARKRLFQVLTSYQQTWCMDRGS